jgi:hypothetical protein
VKNDDKEVVVVVTMAITALAIFLFSVSFACWRVS